MKTVQEKLYIIKRRNCFWKEEAPMFGVIHFIMHQMFTVSEVGPEVEADHFRTWTCYQCWYSPRIWQKSRCVIESMLLYKLVHISLHVSKFTFAFTDVKNIYTMLHPQIVSDAGLEAVHQWHAAALKYVAALCQHLIWIFCFSLHFIQPTKSWTQMPCSHVPFVVLQVCLWARCPGRWRDL